MIEIWKPIKNYEEYLKLQECYDIVHKERHNVSYNYPPDDEKYTQYMQDTELFELLNDGRFNNDTLQRIVIEKGKG